MWTILFARVDDRLIHGQVITKWAKSVQPNLIVIVDDVLAADEFMRNVYRMSAPPGVQVKVVDVKTASQEWQRNGSEQIKVFMLFKGILTAKDAIERGLPIRELNVGGISKKPGGNSKQFLGCVSLQESDVKMLLDLKETWNVETYFQMVPDCERLELPSIVRKYFSRLQI